MTESGKPQPIPGPIVIKAMRGKQYRSVETGAALASYTCYIFEILYMVYLLYVCNGHYAYYTYN